MPTKTSPINIKSKFSLAKNHGEYWGNLDEIHIPFAKRLLSINLDRDGVPDEWVYHKQKGNRWHPTMLLFGWIAAIGFIYTLIYWIPRGIPWVFGISPFTEVEAFLGNSIQAIFDAIRNQSAENSEPSLWDNLYKPITRIWEKNRSGILNSFLIVTGVIAAWEWGSQLWRAFQTGKVSIEEIEGIGKKYAQILRGNSILTNKDLLLRGATKSGRNQIVRETNISKVLILQWVNHADLMRVEGIGSEYSDLLEEAGVDTVKELRRRNPLNLYKKIKEVEKKKNLVRKLPSQNDVEVWVDEAKRIKPMVTY